MSAPRSVFGGSDKPVELNLGMFGCLVVGYTARERPESLKQLCTNGHAPQTVTMPTKCAVCGEVGRETLARGREVGKGTWVVVSQEDVKAIKDVGTFGQEISLDCVPLADVENSTRWGDKTYYLAPKAKTNPLKYTVLRDLIKTRTDRAFVANFAPRTAVAMFRLTVINDVIVMQELVTADNMKEAPAAEPSCYTEGTLEAASAWVDQNVASAFDPATYTDQAAARLEAHLQALEAVDGATGVMPAAPIVPVIDQAADVLSFFSNQLAAVA
jgi:non-homologous end joining protein Ku